METMCELKEIIDLLVDSAPFLAIVVSLVALLFGPYIAGRTSRQQTVAVMREKWIYAFRDCLVELTTRLDVLHEDVDENGVIGRVGSEYSEYLSVRRELMSLENRIRLMTNSAGEPECEELISCIEKCITMVLHGIKDYGEYHKVSDRLKVLAQQAIHDEWKKI